MCCTCLEGPVRAYGPLLGMFCAVWDDAVLCLQGLRGARGVQRLAGKINELGESLSAEERAHAAAQTMDVFKVSPLCLSFISAPCLFYKCAMRDLNTVCFGGLPFSR